MTIIRDHIDLTELVTLAEGRFGDLVKAVVDVNRGIMAVGSELHADDEAAPLDDGSHQADLWGINLYPADYGQPSWLEFDSMINVRPSVGNRSRSVEDPAYFLAFARGARPRDAGELEPDVRVGDWSMPWNAKAATGRLAPGIPKSDFWANDPRGIEQVGCVYTAQGFKFDYVGVIFGPDLVYRTLDGGWVGQRDQSHDRIVRSGVTEQQFTDFVKSTYRVLLTRGLRGCYVYFMDAPTRDFVLSRFERPTMSQARAAEFETTYGASDE